MRALAFTVSFLLAFLLFAVQPMATKMVLPTLGGTPAVWNTAMFTFQMLLLAGYAYAHFLNSRLVPSWQWRIHGLLIAASFLFLPLSVHLVSSEALLKAPILHLAMGFLLQIGLPFFVLSATAPLLQAWVSRSNHPLSQTPYVLYSASNLGSMMGLLGYVAFVEPNLTLPQQSMGWSALFVAGTIALMLAGKMLKPAAAEVAAAISKPRTRTILLWVLLSFLPSSLSLGVTSYITTDIAAVPLLWVLPLALYLLSFVDAFRTRPLIVPIAMRVAPVLGMLGLLAYGMQAQRFSQIFVFQLVVFAFLAFCLHGWLARFKPASQHLTAFYFSMSVGGALGGLLNALVAPILFSSTIEYPMSLLVASITGFVLWQRGRGGEGFEKHLFIFSRVLATILVNAGVFYVVFGVAMGDFAIDDIQLNGQTLLMAGSFAAVVAIVIYRRYAHLFYATAVLGLLILVLTASGSNSSPMVFRERSFFGVWKITDQPNENSRYLIHNTTVHGAQFMKQEGPLVPLTYYWGLKGAFDNLPVLRQHPYALIGLGSGTVKCFAREGQQVDLFEIDPMVVRIAEDPKLFRYLKECPGHHNIYLGDGRIMFEQQPKERYGALVIDAFSSDSIPAHLITHEAIQMYFEKLVPHGILLVHTTNRHINLWPLLAGQAQQLGMFAYGKRFMPEDDKKLDYQNYWVAIAHDPNDLAPMMKEVPGWESLSPLEGTKPWTDDYVNILPYLKMLHRED